jgi:hypothetical protein
MRTGINTARLGVIVAQIAGCGFYTYAGYLVSRMCRIVEFRGKRVQVDISVRAVSGAQSASDAPVFDDHFERVATAD